MDRLMIVPSSNELPMAEDNMMEPRKDVIHVTLEAASMK